MKSLVIGFKDVYSSFKNYIQFLVFGFQDIKVRYQRSPIGLFWLTINMSVYILILSFIFGFLLKQSLKEYLPYITLGIIFWTFISTNIVESCTAFYLNRESILNINLNFFFYIARIIWKNTIIFLHNIIIVPIIFLFVDKSPSIYALLTIPGFIILTLNLMWIMLVIAIICTRYRDMFSIISNLVQITFYATPILWSADLFKNSLKSYVLDLNFFNHLLSIVRDPIIGHIPSSNTWIISIILMFLGWIFSLFFLGSYKGKIAYWL
jgi:lipopolysaccharide transport system permease protein